MAEYGNIRIPREDFERHNQRREDMGLTWAEYMEGQAPEGGGTTVEVNFEDEQVGELAEYLSKALGSDLEMAAFRGARDALEEVVE